MHFILSRKDIALNRTTRISETHDELEKWIKLITETIIRKNLLDVRYTMYVVWIKALRNDKEEEVERKKEIADETFLCDTQTIVKSSKLN